jgi:hypothetical protein
MLKFLAGLEEAHGILLASQLSPSIQPVASSQAYAYVSWVIGT